jgi:hypothetical protein
MMKCCIACLFLALSVIGHAQSSDRGTYHVIGANLHTSYVIVHSRDIAAIGNSYPVATSLSYMFQYVDQSTWDLCLCSPKAGFGLEFWSFDNNRILGYGISPTLLLEPVFIGSGRLHFSIRLAFGVPYLSKPFDSLSNPKNVSYSSRLALYGSMGGQLNYQLSPNWTLHLGAGYNHISSGGITEPNKGINFPTAIAGVSYAARPLELNRFEKADWRQPGLPVNRVGFEMFGTLIRKVDDTWYMVGGGGFHYLKRISRINSLGAHAEVLKQGAHKDSAVPGQTDFLSIGIAPTNEIILGRFLFSQAFGFYLKKSDIEKRDVYQRYMLNFDANHWLLIGLGLRAHGHVADFLDVRVTIKHIW